MTKQDKSQPNETNQDKKHKKAARLMGGGPRCWKCKYFNRDLSLNFSVNELKARGLGHCMFNSPMPVQVSLETFCRGEAYLAVRPLVKDSEFCGNFVLNEDAEY